jgi:predicted nucleic acid-binding protein
LGLYYLDTSAVVKLYIREPGTDRVLRIASRRADNRMAVLSLTAVEFRSAIRKRERSGDIDHTGVARTIAKFEHHIEARFLRQTLNESVVDLALGLIDRYPIRAYDALQLAGCLTLRAIAGGDDPLFVCADQVLLASARSEGLSVLDPAAPE